MDRSRRSPMPARQRVAGRGADRGPTHWQDGGETAKSPPMRHSILVLDDDPHIREVVCFALAKAGMAARAAEDGTAALRMAGERAPDLIVLDINMPEMDGLELCRTIRRDSDVPILFLSSRDDEIDRVLGLELGADDYVTKPFSPRELVARINAILKRARAVPPEADGAVPVRAGALEIDPLEHRVSWQGTEVALTATEFQLLLTLARQPRRVFGRDELMRAIYAPNVHVSDRTLDSHIRHVRAKLAAAGGDRLIETVHGVGFRLGLR